MASGGANDDETPFDELLAQLLDDGKSYARAEIKLVRAEAEAKVTTKLEAVRKPLLLGAAALLLVQAGVIVLCMTIALSLATLVGPLAGGLIATLLTFGGAGLLGWLAKRHYEART